MAKKDKTKNKVQPFKTGQIIQHKDTGDFAVVLCSYAQRFGGDDYSSLYIVWLDAFKQHGHESAWHNAADFTLVPFEQMVLFCALHSK